MFNFLAIFIYDTGNTWIHNKIFRATNFPCGIGASVIIYRQTHTTPRQIKAKTGFDFLMKFIAAVQTMPNHWHAVSILPLHFPTTQ